MDYRIEYAPGRALIYFKKSPQKVRDRLRLMGVRYLPSGNYWLVTRNIEAVADYLEKYNEHGRSAKRKMEEYHFEGKPQLCEKCGKAAGTMGWCSWSRHLKPVKGWTAEKSEIKFKSGHSYHISACPEFVSDGS